MATNTPEEVEEVEKMEPEVTSLEEFPPELLIKHPLQHTWTLWFYELQQNKLWQERQRQVTSFDTAEDFWSLYNHMKLASELRIGTDYSMFKQGIQPMWEDEANKHGGRWTVNLDRKQRSTELDYWWLETLLYMIGEGFNAYSDDICGAVVGVRNKQDKISIWTSKHSNHVSVMEIGRQFKELLKVPSNVIIGYQAHKDNKNKSGNAIKLMYTL